MIGVFDDRADRYLQLQSPEADDPVEFEGGYGNVYVEIDDPNASATGRVVSGKGGTPSEVPCPWCEGTGRFIPEHDAPAARRG